MGRWPMVFRVEKEGRGGCQSTWCCRGPFSNRVLDIMIPSLAWNQLRLVKETINVLSQRPAELISMPPSESMLPPC